MGICARREWKDNSGVTTWSAVVGLRSGARTAGKCFWMVYTQGSLLYHSLRLATTTEDTRRNVGHAGKAAVWAGGEPRYGSEGQPPPLLPATHNILACDYISEAEKRLPASPPAQRKASSALYTRLSFLHHLYLKNTALTSPQTPQFTTQVSPKLTCCHARCLWVIFFNFLFTVELKKDRQHHPAAMILEHLKGVLPVFLFHAPRGVSALLLVRAHTSPSSRQSYR